MKKNTHKKALLNKDFRQAISFTNREAYAAQLNARRSKQDHPVTLYIPPTFCPLSARPEMVKLNWYLRRWVEI